MQSKIDNRPTMADGQKTVAFSKEALALISGAAAPKTNALDQVSHAVYFR